MGVRVHPNLISPGYLGELKPGRSAGPYSPENQRVGAGAVFW